MKNIKHPWNTLSLSISTIYCSFLFISALPSNHVFFHNLLQNHFDTLLQVVEKNSPEEPEQTNSDIDLFTVNFPEISMSEFIRFVSKITKKNFIYREESLNFSIALISGRALSADGILQAMQDILEKRGLGLVEREDYFLVEKLGIVVREEDGLNNLTTSLQIPYSSDLQNKLQFIVHKLKYHEGDEILTTMKQMTIDPELLNKSLCQAIQSMQFNKNTNSISFFGTNTSIQEVQDLLTTLDAPLKQVFIEILVLETNVSEALDFGVEWSVQSNSPEYIDLSMNTMLAKSIYRDYNYNKSKQPLKNCGINLDLGIIGNRILHKNNHFLTLSALVSALQTDSNSTIVLNQKIITQDNKNSKIFVGDSIPFNGSIVQITGIGQQITTNIEYRDVGVSLNIKPLLGDGDIITIELSEEITEALDEPMTLYNRGIRTTKTNMITSTHVPDQHFLLLSGSNRTVRRKSTRSVPCLGAIPLIGRLFRTESTERDKRSTLIFIRPQVIHSFEQYKSITKRQTNACSKESKQELQKSCIEQH